MSTLYNTHSGEAANTNLKVFDLTDLTDLTEAGIHDTNHYIIDMVLFNKDHNIYLKVNLR